jgi:glycosyltransferase involved in cell wall biosynthesis
MVPPAEASRVSLPAAQGEPTNRTAVAGHGTRPKRILHVHKVRGVAGSERHLQILLPRLDPRRFDVTFLLLLPPHWAVDEYVRSFRASAVDTDVATIRSDIDPQCLLDVYRFIRKGRFDLVHTHLIHADLYGGLAARLAGVPRVVSTRHNDDPFRRGAGGTLWRLAARRSDRVIVLSRYLAQFVQRVEGVNPGRIVTIPYGLPPASGNGRGTATREDLGLPPDGPLVASVGRLVRQKGHRDLLRAWPRVVAAFPRARLLIVGEGPLRRRLLEETSALGIRDSVTFTGWRTDIPALLELADMCVHPSLWEGFGLTLLEAMAAGRCIVASRVSTIPEVVLDGETGRLVPPGDSGALAEAIVQLLADPERRRKLGEAGRRRLTETFGVERMARATEAVYDELLR